ncbi:diaminobutyrate acetyltransferase [Paenibacillus piri]|uniref:L-2,4-diaminobutyric acid acetyltransferase n=1 Tax=Paenibacillus piri TaxID=2547395 RepID=A0A4R5KQI9_9BACL|nr:diaminobutyrate acetyltransferase [Paenibacillus piri]
MKETAIRFRRPEKKDGTPIWKLIQQTEALDVNSAYCYILLSDYLRDTCVIAEEEEKIVGFISAFRAPSRNDTLFVWQIAVAPSKQRRGIARRMLKELLARECCSDVVYIEATVSPSNLASRGLLLRLAKDYRMECHLSAGYADALFPVEARHEEELLFRLGPLPVMGER